MIGLKHSILPEGTEFGDFTRFSGDAVRGKTPVIDDIYNYWASKHREGHLPSRSDIRPSEIVEHLDHLVMMEVQYQETGFSLLVRLIGTHVANFYGEITGKDICEMENKLAANRIYHLSSLVLSEKLPQLSVTPAFAPDRQYLEAYALYLPLHTADDVIDKILVSVDVRSLRRQQ